MDVIDAVGQVVQATNGQPWSFELLVALAAAGGAIGGIAELLLRLEVTDGAIVWRKCKLTLGIFAFLLASQVFVGVCGAAAVSFIFSSTTWFPTVDTPIHRLWLLSLSVVAGYSAKRFMTIVTQRLEREVATMNEEIEENKEKLEENKERVEQIALLSQSRDIVARAMTLIGRGKKATSTELNASLIELMEWLRAHPTDRTPAIIASRIYRELEDYPNAIKHLGEFVRAKASANQKDGDYAAGLYQRACYTCLFYTGKENDPEYLVAKQRALADLENAIKHDPQNAEGAAEDVDFGAWFDDPDFKRITGS